MRRLIKMLLSDSLWTALLLAAGAGCFVLGAWLLWQGGRAWSRGIDRQQAIDTGVGRWTIDEKTGARVFVYGPAPAAQTPIPAQPSGPPPVKPLVLDPNPYNDASGPGNGLLPADHAPIFAEPKKEKVKK